MKKIIYSILLFTAAVFMSINLAAQEKYIISGQIKSAKSGEEQIGASVYVKELKSGTVTNAYGFYSITLPKGKYTIVSSYMGFRALTKTVDLSANVKLDFELVEVSNQLNGVVVVAERAEYNVKSMEMSLNKLDIKHIQKLPTFAF